MRRIAKWSSFKAAEYRHFIEYDAGPLLKGRVPEDVYTMVMSLQYGIRLLAGSRPVDPGEWARRTALKHFKYYIEMYKHLFGKYSIR
jgi:hypothetical protein